MDLQKIIDSLSPINRNEKVDTLIQMMREKGIALTKTNDIAIRCAIQKMSVQKYYDEHYGSIVLPDDIKKREERHLGFVEHKVKAETGLKVRRPQKSKKKEKPKTSQPADAHPRRVPSALLTFSREYKDKDKVVKDETKRDQERHRGLIRPTSTTSSVSHISIPAGGMNKRY